MKKTKRQMNVRVDAMTRRHIDELCAQLGLSKPELLMLAVDRLWMQEFEIVRVTAQVAKRAPEEEEDEYDGPEGTLSVEESIDELRRYAVTKVSEVIQDAPTTYGDDLSKTPRRDIEIFRQMRYSDRD